MTPMMVLSNAVLGALLLAAARMAPPARDRFIRWIAAAGVASGLAIVLFRSSMGTWRGFDIGADEAAVTGLAVACAWGLVISLDLDDARWWTGGLVAAVSAGLIAFAASAWAVPALLFGACAFAATHLALARGSRAAWLAIAIADAGLVAVLVSDVLTRDEWSAPNSIRGVLVIPLLVSMALRAGLLPRVGPLGALGTPAAALGPLTVGLSFIVVLRWVDRPQPGAAAAAVIVALGVVAWSLLGKKLNPAVAGAWPVALCGALVLASANAGVSGAFAAIIGTTSMILWPDALERGRLSRGFVFAGVVPTIAFGAIAAAAVDSFAHATAGGDRYEVAAWILFAALLPVASASGVALGVFVARAEPTGGYHPEAVFMTWVLAGGSVATGLVLGAGRVYGVMGGPPAAILFTIALGLGALAAARAGAVPSGPPGVSSVVVVSSPIGIGSWATAVALSASIAASSAVVWLAIRGLEVGFL